MADDFIRVPPDSTGKAVRTKEMVVAGATVQVHYMIPIDSSDNEISVDIYDGVLALQSLVAATTKCDTDNVIITSMPALTPQNAGDLNHGAVTVSTAATLIRSFAKATPGLNSFAFIEITNNGSGDLYVGFANTVTTSGATMGVKVLPGGCLSLGPGWNSDYQQITIYGIYSEAAASQNVAFLVGGVQPD